jgi:S1-C subfamily serine protease
MRPSRRFRTAIIIAAFSVLPGLEAADLPRPGDDATYRPTVMVRRGKSLGSGTIIASVEGETLILTAAHVVTDSAPLFVELFRYNFGVEHVQAVKGFPKLVEASVVARDLEADLAILRIRGQLAFPYVARIAKGDTPPAIGARVTSIGFDKGAKLIGFSTRVRSVAKLDFEKSGVFRPFVVTDDPPEVGRSGGGLFLADGSLVGVCIARADHPEGQTLGLFSTLGNVRRLIEENEDIAASMARASRKNRSPAR